jgi:uncharacterized protein YukE
MTGAMRVDPAQVRTLGQDMVEYAAKLDGQLDELRERIKRVVDQWEGEDEQSAKQQYNIRQKEWDDAADALLSKEKQGILPVLGMGLQDAADDFEKGEKGIANMFGS